MRKWLFAALAAACLAILPQAAIPQTAQPVLPGYRTNANCPSVSLTPCWSPNAQHVVSGALGNSLIVKASAGVLLGFNCTGVTGGAAGYCVAYNSGTVPGTGALTGAQVLDACYFGTTANGCALLRTPFPVPYSNGIVILVTTAASPLTYTTGTATALITAD